MILERIIADVFAENCYVVANEIERHALVIDPGSGTAAAVARTLTAHNLTLGAVLLTHGHSDHLWDAAAVAGDLPIYIPEPDLYRVDEPFGPPGNIDLAYASLFQGPYARPRNVRTLPPALLGHDGAQLLPGIPLRALAAPGHTEGSTVYFLDGTWGPEVVEMAGAQVDGSGREGLLAFTGDVIFKDSIGRTDFPGGDDAVMRYTLRTLKQVIHPDTMLFPGHGEATMMRRELAHNPFLI